MFYVSSCSCRCPRCPNYIWVINNFITCYCAAYIRGLTVDWSFNRRHMWCWCIEIGSIIKSVMLSGRFICRKWIFFAGFRSELGWVIFSCSFHEVLVRPVSYMHIPLLFRGELKEKKRRSIIKDFDVIPEDPNLNYGFIWWFSLCRTHDLKWCQKMKRPR